MPAPARAAVILAAAINAAVRVKTAAAAAAVVESSFPSHGRKVLTYLADNKKGMKLESLILRSFSRIVR